MLPYVRKQPESSELVLCLIVHFGRWKLNIMKLEDKSCGINYIMSGIFSQDNIWSSINKQINYNYQRLQAKVQYFFFNQLRRLMKNLSQRILTFIVNTFSQVKRLVLILKKKMFLKFGKLILRRFGI